jgi:predicted methyltransferase
VTPAYQAENPTIRLECVDDEMTLYIDGGQAMQAWERPLMEASADLLCGYGSEFLEVGLGLGLSALRIARHPSTRRHVVIEKHQHVIDLFRDQHPELPSNLEIAHADFFDMVGNLDPSSLDGIFFDPYLGSADMWKDAALWNRVVPAIVRALRTGGAFLPCFTIEPVLRWQFVPFFDRVIVERRSFTAYLGTEYIHRRSGSAFIQCFVKT